MKKRVLLRIIVILVALVVAIPAYYSSGYYYNLGRFVSSLQEGDVESARQYLLIYKSYYNTFAGMPFGGLLADKILFREAWYYEALYYYNRGEYEKTVDMLRGQDDYRAQHVAGNALFRAKFVQYHAVNDPEKKKQILDEILEEVSMYYERSLREMSLDADRHEFFKDQWNYDLTSDEQAAKAALEQPKKGDKKVIELGYEGEEPGTGRKGDTQENPFNVRVPGGKTTVRKKVG